MWRVAEGRCWILRQVALVAMFTLLLVVPSARGQNCPASLSVTYNPDSNHVTGTFNVPVTCGPFGWTVWDWHVNGTNIGGEGNCNISDCTIPIDFSVCSFANGTYTITYRAACTITDGHGGCAPGQYVSNTTNFTVQHVPPSATMTVAMNPSTNSSNSYTATITYTFPATSDQGDRYINLSVLPANDATGGTIQDWGSPFGTPLNVQGTVTRDVTEEAHRMLRMKASLCGAEMHQDVGVDAHCCPANATQDPVQLSDGAFSYTERDPLPDDFGLVFQRT